MKGYVSGALQMTPPLSGCHDNAANYLQLRALTSIATFSFSGTVFKARGRNTQLIPKISSKDK